jgi:hypothetical protein
MFDDFHVYDKLSRSIIYVFVQEKPQSQPRVSRNDRSMKSILENPWVSRADTEENPTIWNTSLEDPLTPWAKVLFSGFPQTHKLNDKNKEQ